MKLLKILKRLFRNPRLHPRFSVDNGVLVLIEPHAAAPRQVQMVNISEGGCAFIYNGSRKRFESIRFSQHFSSKIFSVLNA